MAYLLSVEDYEQGALRKEPIITHLTERFQTSTLRIFYWELLLAIYLTIFTDLLLIENFEQCALQKELVIAAFVEWFLTTTLRKHD